MAGLILGNAARIPLADKSVQCVVLDLFVGSGTTVAEAVRLGRRGIGMDLSKEYLCELASKRTQDIQPVLMTI